MLRGFGTQGAWVMAAVSAHVAMLLAIAYAGSATTRHPFNATGSCLTITALSIVVAAWCMRANLRDVRLLRRGLEVEGRLVADKETGEDGGVFWLTFEYSVGGKLHQSEVRTESAREWLRDEPTARMRAVAQGRYRIVHGR
jgi:hypothetical protein